MMQSVLAAPPPGAQLFTGLSEEHGGVAVGVSVGVNVAVAV